MLNQKQKRLQGPSFEEALLPLRGSRALLFYRFSVHLVCSSGSEICPYPNAQCFIKVRGAWECEVLKAMKDCDMKPGWAPLCAVSPVCSLAGSRGDREDEVYTLRFNSR